MEVDGNPPVIQPHWPAPEEHLFRLCHSVLATTYASAVSNPSCSGCLAALIPPLPLCSPWMRSARIGDGCFLPARYSSTGSLTDAEALAKISVSAGEVLPIEPAFKSHGKAVGRRFRRTKPNEAEENIQSRLRGVTLMALSNKFSFARFDHRK